MGKPAPHANHEEQWQFQVVDEIAQRIAGLEQAGTLNEDDRPSAAQVQPGRHSERFALTADADQA